MLKILEARLQQYVNWELSDWQARFLKGRGIRENIAKNQWFMEKASGFQKNMYFCFTDYAKAFDCVDHKKLKHYWIDEIARHPTWLLKNLYVGQEAIEPNMEKLTGFKLGKEYKKSIYCHPSYLTYMQSTSCAMPSWLNYNLESKLLGEILTTSNMQKIPL